MKKSIKEQYAGLDVSLKSVSICVSDESGKLLWHGEVENDPSEVAQTLARRAPKLIRAVLETGSCGIHLYRGLEAFGVPVVCACARHAKGALVSYGDSSLNILNYPPPPFFLSHASAGLTADLTFGEEKQRGRVLEITVPDMTY